MFFKRQFKKVKNNKPTMRTAEEIDIIFDSLPSKEADKFLDSLSDDESNMFFDYILLNTKNNLMKAKKMSLELKESIKYKEFEINEFDNFLDEVGSFFSSF